MYGWLWRVFPGGLVGKLCCSVVALAAALALLFFIVFPRVEALLPYQDVNVDVSQSATPSAPPP